MTRKQKNLAFSLENAGIDLFIACFWVFWDIGKGPELRGLVLVVVFQWILNSFAIY